MHPDLLECYQVGSADTDDGITVKLCRNSVGNLDTNCSALLMKTKTGVETFMKAAS